MPQINRIRVNNVKYNFGTQYYDDFMMRFSTRNTIYDLANGGGKSVLMLLLMQNMIPNCTLDDKQPVEKLFRQGNDNTTIHSLIEWKLDACDMQNGYQYMTTGFCARKGRDTGENRLEDRETASVEYFNYCIFYREYGEHDIKNLPLTKNGERVTYNGLKSFLRDLEKKDLGVSVYIFDRKGDYQAFITRYGLYESQWEIVRGINRTEGHVRTYFETNYKTTRKVIEDLLIEGIIEKSYNNRIGMGDDDGMAQTLLDIKDQLVELSRRKNEIAKYDEQIELLKGFSSKLDAAKQLYRRKQVAQESLLAYLVAVKSKLSDKQAGLEALYQKTETLDAKLLEEKRQIAVAEVVSLELECKELEQLLAATTRELEAIDRALLEDEEKLRYMEVASEYQDYLRYEKQIMELKELLNQDIINANEEELVRELQGLAASKWQFLSQRLAQMSETERELSESLTRLSKECEETGGQKEALFGQIHEQEGYRLSLLRMKEEKEQEIQKLMEKLQLAISSEAEARSVELATSLDAVKTNISRLTEEIEASAKKREQCEREQAQVEYQLQMEAGRKDSVEGQLILAREKLSKLSHLKEIYNVNSVGELSETMTHIVDDLRRRIWTLEQEKQLCEERITTYERGELPKLHEKACVLADYLSLHYPSAGAVTGKEYLGMKTPQEAAELLQKCPILPYAILVTDQLTEIHADGALRRLDTEDLVIPVLSVEQAESGLYESDSLLYRDMAFVYNEAECFAECRKIKETENHIVEELTRLCDRFEVICADADAVASYEQGETVDSLQESLTSCEAQLKAMDERRCVLSTQVDGFFQKEQQLSCALEEERARASKLSEEHTQTLQAVDLLTQSDALGVQLREVEELRRKLLKDYHIAEQAFRDQSEKLRNTSERLDTLREEQKASKLSFEEEYGKYFSREATPMEGLTEEEIDAKAGALRMRLKHDEGNLADKEKLLATYEKEQQKTKEQIRYHGMRVEEAAEAYAAGQLFVAGMEDRLRLKQSMEVRRHERARINDTLDAQSAQKNRFEGSISHAIAQYEAQYGAQFGAFESMPIEKPQTYIAEHQRACQLMKEELKETKAAITKVETENKDFLLMERDLERIVKNAGLTIPQIVASPEKELVIETAAYEQAQKEYEQLLREENRLRNHFADEKQALATRMHELEAFELSEELRASLAMPENEADVDMMLTGLAETCDCLVLERDYIEQNISDMKRIKDSFEERCIQICANIRTELERLPKLSRITLDEEPVSMITLTIPYVKEELYKDRMSSYINETVASAEHLESREERLKYIRGRLSWKRLFSVIVTDMSSIRLCLYKREHMKNQSRYLRYEEAVGSTGQSQGIYIQFLIAMIHYISSINAMGRDTGVIGKTIFIDNPFGAAKDVYIWEPIFKLLKTNHVQLVVPARGATPAITGMFDVNYVLGQKMMGHKLQTVVVDYHSQIAVEQMDYEVLEYEQTTLPLE